MKANKLLIDEHPLQVLPSLAQLIGLNEAIVLQQVHYWLKIAEKAKDKRKFFLDTWWTFGTYEDWQVENFPFWSKATVGRIFRSLEDKKLLLSRQPDAKDWDHKKWYTIDYLQLETIERSNLLPSNVSDWNERELQDETILNRNTETSSETSSLAPDGAQKRGDMVDGFLHYAQKGNGKKDMAEWPEDIREPAQEFARVFGLSMPESKSARADWIEAVRNIRKDAQGLPLAAIFEEGKHLAERENWLVKIGRPAALVKSLARITKSIQVGLNDAPLNLAADGSFYV